MKAVSLFLFFCLTAAVAQPPTAWTPEYSLQVQNVSAVVPSPDGQVVAWVQSKPRVDGEHSEQISQIFIARADGSHRFQLTRGEKGASSPAFAPDGRYVYFTSDRSGKMNVFRILIEGGEAEMVTEFKGSVSAFKVSPDGKWVAFAGYEPPPDLENAKKEKRDFRTIDADPESHALYIVPAEMDLNGKRAQKKVFEANYHVANFNWSPDSRYIAFEHWPGPLADNWTKADISEVEVETGKVKTLAATGASETSPHYSPDGRYLAFNRSSDPPRWAGDERIMLLSRSDGTSRSLPPTFDETPTLIGWSGDSTRIIFSETHRARAALFAIPVDGPPKTLYEPDHGTVSSGALNGTGTHVGFSLESPQEAPEAFLMKSNGRAKPVRVSRANLDLPKLPLGETKVMSWKSKDGAEIEGLLTLPVGYEQGKRYPLILNIHGGPAGVFTENFIGRLAIYPIATFSARGYAVLRPNPRGSSGYGKQFRFANVGDWGGKDYEDDMAGVDRMIAMGIADADRTAVMGWSYGGFMTSWIITHTNRFKAAAVGAGVTNLWSFTGTADIPGFLPDYFGGEAWDAFEAFQKHSPMSFVKNVQTPTLILHGEADVRVPTSQGYELYNALKRQGVTTKMVVYPRTPHGPREPKFVLDIAQRHLDWVDKYVR
jgi:dipeptidyl aminopeptidase/acylaminoacyl peptidase